MIKVTPLTLEKAPKLLNKCRENLVLLQANTLEITRGYADIEQTTNAIDNALDCVSEWINNLDATLYQHSLEYGVREFIKDSSDVSYCFMAMEHLKEVLEELKGDSLLYDLFYKKEIVAKRKAIDKRYYSNSSKKHKRPPQYWCFSYNSKILERNEIWTIIEKSKYAEDVLSIGLAYSYLKNEYKDLKYSTCGRIHFRNGATINALKELFPGANLYMGKAAHDFYEQNIAEYYGPTYEPQLWQYHF